MVRAEEQRLPPVLQTQEGKRRGRRRVGAHRTRKAGVCGESVSRGLSRQGLRVVQDSRNSSLL